VDQEEPRNLRVNCTERDYGAEPLLVHVVVLVDEGVLERGRAEGRAKTLNAALTA
jgi:hypothetical protein